MNKSKSQMTKHLTTKWKKAINLYKKYVYQDHLLDHQEVG